MTVGKFHKTDDLLMDVDALDFVNDQEPPKINSEAMDVDEQEELEKDSVSDAPVTHFVGGQPIHEPIEDFNREGKALKFKLNPISSQSLGFVSAHVAETKLYTSEIQSVDNSTAYSQYVSKLFEIYDDLGEDRQFSVPTIGLISNSSREEHLQVVNLAMEATVNELEILIESVKNSKNIARLVDLEESLTILNCLKTIHFTLDSENSRSQFFRDLENWINRTDGEPSEQVIEQVFSTAETGRTYESPFFWKLVNQLLIRGLFKQAIGCLERSHILKDLENKCSATANTLNDVMVLINEYPHHSENAFREWKSTMLQLSQSYSSADTAISAELYDYIRDMLLVLSGTQSKILQYSKTWYESFCGLILFYIPTMELTEEYLQISLEAHPLDVCNNWEQSCVDIIRGKIYSTLPVLESLDRCTAAFTAAFSEAKGLLENDIATMFEDVEEYEDEDLFSTKNSMASYLLNSFALELVSYDDKDLWPVAIGILSLCPSSNNSAKRLAIAELLPHYPFKTNDDIEWLLTVCAKWKLPAVSKTIYKILGNKLLYENNVVEAMSNFSRAGEFEWVKHYSWMIFEASLLQGRPLEDVVINAIVGDEQGEIPAQLLNSVVTKVMRQTLSPYAVLYQFYQYTSAQNWSSSMTNLCALLEAPFLPQEYFILLVAQFLYPLFLKDDARRLSETTLLRIIKTLERCDTLSKKSFAMYEALFKVEHDASLPERLDELIQLVRRKLNFKLCQEFM